MQRATVRIDPHVHSDDSYDGHEPIELVLEHAADIGLDAVVITDHDVMGESLRAAALAPEYGMIGIPGVEVSTAHGHLLAVGVERMPPRRKPYDETVEWIHDHGGIAIVPHPFQRSRHGVRRKHVPVRSSDTAGGAADIGGSTTGTVNPRPVVNSENKGPVEKAENKGPVEKAENKGPVEKAENQEPIWSAENQEPIGSAGCSANDRGSVDAIEVFNAWLFTGYRNRKARRFATVHDLPGIAASDAHTLEYVGRAFTEVTVEVDREPGADESVADVVTGDDVLNAIREGTTSVSGKRAPVPMAAKHYAIAATRKSGYYARTGAVRSATTAKWATFKAVSAARIGAIQGAHRLGRAVSWLR